MRNVERAALRAGMMEQVEIGEEAALNLPEATEKNFKFGSVFTGDGIKKGFKKIGLRNFIIVMSVLLIDVAVYANWALFGVDKPVDDIKPSGADPTESGESNYFSVSMIERQRARDEAMEVLQGVVDDAESMAAVKEQALSDIAAMAATIELEANIETLVKSKGFDECVAVVNGDKANIVVKSEGLLPNQLSQILEIVYTQAGILPANVTISEK
ncbi:MAG: SpoIIIAH-like family protein [Ruminococcus sp.]|nr:SpoIIIAH-like family protein [Candidatus Apopatosoma intestinale]